MTCALQWPETAVGKTRDGRPIEWSGTMKALVYFGQQRMDVVNDRPLVCTDQDMIARVERVHRCGTDVKIYYKGRPDQCEESLLDELRSIFACPAQLGETPFTAYSSLVLGGPVHRDIHDPFYRHIADRIASFTPSERIALSGRLRHHWGRILGHETVVTIERVGSRVRELHQGIGYLDGLTLDPQELMFEPGQRCVLQSRIAYYDPPPRREKGLRGTQLLGGNITDLAMNLGGAYATHVRLTPEIIASGSVIKVPSGVPDASAALAEPTACLLDCFQKNTHEVGQDDQGSVLIKGVRPGGVTCVIGSGSMALMCAMLAHMQDPVIRMGQAAQTVFIVRSREKADLVRTILADYPVATVVCALQQEMPQAVRAQYAQAYQDRFGRPFRGFDDVIVAAGDAQTVAGAHALLAPTGGRLMMFAGTRGPCSIESGIWHYANAAVLGTSGCNTKMIEVALGLFARGSLNLSRLTGKRYTFDQLETPGGIEGFFGDKHLRPFLEPNRS